MGLVNMDVTKFYLDRLEPLVGGTIVGLIRTGVDEESGDEFFGLSIKFEDGKIKHLILLSDDEGNGPGSFEIMEGDHHD